MNHRPKWVSDGQRAEEALVSWKVGRSSANRQRMVQRRKDKGAEGLPCLGREGLSVQCETLLFFFIKLGKCSPSG